MKKKTTEEFIQDAKKIHGDKYDYSKVNYVNDSVKVCIICPVHGEFFKTPSNHLHKKWAQGCPDCSRLKLSKKIRNSNSEFISKAISIHNQKYDYSKVNYADSNTKVCIICPKHGDFWQIPYLHLSGCGCPKCTNNYHKTNDEWIKSATEIHKHKYDYSKTEYVNIREKVCIICPFHGEFWQLPNHHLQGCGCPKCQSSHTENEIRKLLLENNIKFEEQKRFGWLGSQSLDFYIPSKNIAIECQGKQHFKPIGFFGGIDALTSTKERDNIKLQLCRDNGVMLLYYANYEYDFPYNVFNNKLELLKIIKTNEI